MAEKNNGKPLRFGKGIRVSTEKQEQQGESLRVQDTQGTEDIAFLGGDVVDVYGGQEHATEGFEKDEIERMLADAERHHINAVWFSHVDRWSRDNVMSHTGLDVFLANGIRFFIGREEQNLADPQVRFMLAIHAAVGAYNAKVQTKKSLEARIHRAKRGVPTSGNKPFGRIWDDKGQKWLVDEEKKRIVVDCADRFLAGEAIPKLAAEYGISVSHLYKILRERCGDQWVIDFINEPVVMTVPRLLPEETIRAIHALFKANSTYLHGNPTNEYLLSGRIFCEHCGYSLYATTKPNGTRFYCHPNRERRARPCPLDHPRPWVRADLIEQAVLGDVFNMLGSPAHIERATMRAVPDAAKALKDRDRLEAELKKYEKARNRVLNQIKMDTITDEQATTTLRDLKEQETAAREKLNRLAVKLASLPNAGRRQIYVERGKGFIFLYDDDGNIYEGGNDVQTWIDMTPDDHKALVKVAFGSPLPDGTPAGVRVRPVESNKPNGPKRFTYVLHGRLLGTGRRVTQYARQARQKARRS